MSEKFLTVDQLAARWQCNPESVRRKVRAKLITHVRPFGAAIRFPIKAIEEYEAKRTVKARQWGP